MKLLQPLLLLQVLAYAAAFTCPAGQIKGYESITSGTCSFNVGSAAECKTAAQATGFGSNQETTPSRRRKPKSKTLWDHACTGAGPPFCQPQPAHR